MSGDDKNPRLEKAWRRIGIALFILATIIVAGPQLIDLIDPNFR